MERSWRKDKSDYHLLFDCRLAVNCLSLINRWLLNIRQQYKHRRRERERCLSRGNDHSWYKIECEWIAIEQKMWGWTGVKVTIASIALSFVNVFDFSSFFISTSVQRQGVTGDFLELVPPHPFISTFFSLFPLLALTLSFAFSPFLFRAFFAPTHNKWHYYMGIS